jgi:hypothetical protein
MLRLWIESQPTPVIGLIVFGLTYLFIAILFVLVTIAPHRWTRHFKQLSTVTMMPLAVVLGVLLGFLAARVWANFDRAVGYVGQEAGALSQTLILANSFPPEIRTRLRDQVAAHIKSAEEEEWPSMGRREASAGRSPRALTEAVATILAITPTRAGEHLAQQRALAAVEAALEARRNRIMLSGVTIDKTQWRVIMALFILMLVTIACMHADKPRTNAVALIIIGSAAAICFVLLLAYDHPLNPGGAFIEPTLLREVIAN